MINTMRTVLRSYPEWVSTEEAKTIDVIMARIIADGQYRMRLRYEDHNGDLEVIVPWTTLPVLMRPEIAATDMSVIDVGLKREDGAIEHVGSLFLVHGNGEDVLADMMGKNDEWLERLVTMFEPLSFL